MPIPVVFVHGLWLHSTSWSPWIDLFRENGYDPSAPGWPGDAETVEAARQNPGAVAGHGIDDVVDAYTTEIAKLDSKPIVVGHSFGGLVVQRLLDQGSATAGIAIDAAPIKGVWNLPPSALRVASVALRNPLDRKGATALTREQFRYGFGNALSQQESDELFDRWTIPSPNQPLFEAAFATVTPKSPAAVNTKNRSRGPLLLTAGGKDHTVPAVITKHTLKLYRSGAVTDFQEFPDRGHSLCLDSGWREVAQHCLDWLKKQGI
jgi:non-heme chloroperoxidase